MKNLRTNNELHTLSPEIMNRKVDRYRNASIESITNQNMNEIIEFYHRSKKFENLNLYKGENKQGSVEYALIIRNIINTI